MNKNVQIFVQVDDISLSGLEELLDAIEELLELYEHTRITANIRDEAQIPRRPR